MACSTLYEKLNRASVWRKKANALLDIYEGSFVLAMLNFLRIHQISKPSAFKVVLGVQKLIESTLIDLNSTLAHWRCLQPEYQALNGVITCKVTRIESSPVRYIDMTYRLSIYRHF